MVRGKRRKTIIVVSVVGIVLLAGAIGTWFLFGRSVSPLPKDVVAQASFPVYYPEKLPEGYVLKANSASGDNTAVYYTLTDASGKQSVTVTMQATPPGFDAVKMMGGTPIPMTITPAGTLYNLSIGGTSKYMLVASQTLMFITSSQAIDPKVINTIVNNLTEIK